MNWIMLLIVYIWYWPESLPTGGLVSAFVFVLSSFYYAAASNFYFLPFL